MRGRPCPVGLVLSTQQPAGDSRSAPTRRPSAPRARWAPCAGPESGTWATGRGAPFRSPTSCPHAPWAPSRCGGRRTGTRAGGGHGGAARGARPGQRRADGGSSTRRPASSGPSLTLGPPSAPQEASSWDPGLGDRGGIPASLGAPRHALFCAEGHQKAADHVRERKGRPPPPSPTFLPSPRPGRGQDAGELGLPGDAGTSPAPSHFLRDRARGPAAPRAPDSRPAAALGGQRPPLTFAGLIATATHLLPGLGLARGGGGAAHLSQVRSGNSPGGGSRCGPAPQPGRGRTPASRSAPEADAGGCAAAREPLPVAKPAQPACRAPEPQSLGDSLERPPPAGFCAPAPTSSLSSRKPVLTPTSPPSDPDVFSCYPQHPRCREERTPIGAPALEAHGKPEKGQVACGALTWFQTFHTLGLSFPSSPEGRYNPPGTQPGQESKTDRFNFITEATAG